MKNRNEDIALSFSASVKERGGICPECGRTVTVERIRDHVFCLKTWITDVENIVAAVMLAQSEDDTSADDQP